VAEVVYLGNFQHDHCTEVHLAREMQANGHRVSKVQEPHDANERFVRRLEAKVSNLKPDLFLWTRTWGLPPMATDTWRRFEEKGITTASYHLDLYLGLKRAEKMRRDPFWTTGYVFTPDGNASSERYFHSMGINHWFMPPAVVSDAVHEGIRMPEYVSPLAFVGSWKNYHPEEWPFRQTMVLWLQRRYQREFAAWGANGRGTIREGHLNDLYASVKVVVGDNLSLRGNTHYISDRYFETLGRGGFLVAPYVQILDELGFVHGENIWTYRSADLSDLEYQIKVTLALPPERRKEIVANAMALIKERHTYRHRLQKAFEIMGVQ